VIANARPALDRVHRDPGNDAWAEPDATTPGMEAAADLACAAAN